MKITQVVSYVSVDGSFGGPVTVATEQAKALKKAGYEVDLVAGWDGQASVEDHFRCSLYKSYRLTKRLSTLMSWGVLRHLWRIDPSSRIVHIHMGRDLLSLSAAFVVHIRRIPYVLQTHGMIPPRTSIAVQILDRAVTRRIIRHARRVLVLTAAEESDIKVIAGDTSLVERVNNGVSPIVLENCTIRIHNQVLFLARLHPRKRVLAFAEACSLLKQKGVDFTASIIGPDEGELRSLQEFIDAHELRDQVAYDGAATPSEARQRIAQAGIYVLPSHGEVFPMTVLEALAAGTPVITTKSSGLAETLELADASRLVDGSPHEIAEAIQVLISNREEWEKLQSNGWKLVQDRLGIAAVSEHLLEIYSSALTKRAMQN